MYLIIMNWVAKEFKFLLSRSVRHRSANTLLMWIKYSQDKFPSCMHNLSQMCVTVRMASLATINVNKMAWQQNITFAQHIAQHFIIAIHYNKYAVTISHVYITYISLLSREDWRFKLILILKCFISMLLYKRKFHNHHSHMIHVMVTYHTTCPMVMPLSILLNI